MAGLELQRLRKGISSTFRSHLVPVTSKGIAGSGLSARRAVEHPVVGLFCVPDLLDPPEFGAGYFQGN